MISAAIYAFYPPYIWSFYINDTIPLFTLILIWSIVFWSKVQYSSTKKYYFLAIGMTIGLSMLVRPITLFIPIIIIITLLIQQIKPTAIAWVVVALLLTIGPWIITASIAEQRFVPLSTGGMPTIIVGFKKFPENKVAAEFMKDKTAQSKPIEFLKFTVKNLIKHPADSFMLWSKKSLKSFYATDAGGKIEQILAIANFSLLLLGIIGCTKMSKISIDYAIEQKNIFNNLIVIFFYFWLMTTVVLSILRYMIPVMWIPIGLAFLGLIYIAKPQYLRCINSLIKLY